MPEFMVNDQAAGLRRLFGHARTTVFAFASATPGSGQSTTIANLAYLLAKDGHQVLVLDENTSNSQSALYGILEKGDLQLAVNQQRDVRELVLSVGEQIRLMPIAVATQKLGKLGGKQQASLLECFCSAELRADIILVDTSRDHPLGFSPFGLAAHECIMVTGISQDAVTSTYAQIKRVRLGYGLNNVRILVTQAKTPREAVRVIDSLTQVASEHRVAMIQRGGMIPLDQRINQARRLSQPVAAIFPESLAVKAFYKLAQEMKRWVPQSEDPVRVEHFVDRLLVASQTIDPVAIYA